MRLNVTNKSKESGFTLVELLIVIIIIGILAAIAFVAYSGATNNANKGAAQSTLSEVRSKLAEYNGDNGYYPTTQATFNTWLTSIVGGDNASLSTTFSAAGYSYTASPASCNNTTTPCTGYTVKAVGTMFGGTSPANDITLTN
jgi:prepilin-type N-terminal cleavage/methylation domain-containing protein